MSNTVAQQYDLSYEGDGYLPLLDKLARSGLNYPASKILESLTFSREITWQQDMIKYSLFVDRNSCLASVQSNNLVA